MIKEAIEKIQQLADQAAELKKFSIGNRNYVYSEGTGLLDDQPALPGTMRFYSLSGFAQYIESERDKEFINGTPAIHIVNATRIEFVDEARPVYANRCVLAAAEPLIPKAFPFDQFMSIEMFMIKVQAQFIQNVGDWDAVVKNCAGIKKQDGMDYKDSGVTQSVTVQSGLSLAGIKDIPNPVSLAPYRTFAEIEQPVSRFVLRVSDGREGPTIALFEADGGAWQIDANAKIKEWLEKRLPGVTVLA